MKIDYDKLLQLKKHLLNVVFEGAELEGLGLTYAKTAEIINNTKLSKDKYSYNQIQAVIGMKQAYEYIFTVIENNRPIDTNIIRQINKIIDEYEEPELAGLWRTRQNSIGGTYYIPQVLKSSQYESIINNGIKEPLYFSKIIKLYIDITKNQCFADGNKRTALVFCNLVLVKNGLDFIKILDHHIFKRKLVNCYEDLDNAHEDFVNYVLKTSKFIKMDEIEKEKINSKFISVGSMISKNVYLKLTEIANSQRTTIGKMLKQYLNEISSGMLKDFHYVNKENRLVDLNNSNHWIGCRLKNNEYQNLQKFAAVKKLSIYQIIKWWADNKV